MSISLLYFTRCVLQVRSSRRLLGAFASAYELPTNLKKAYRLRKFTPKTARNKFKKLFGSFCSDAAYCGNLPVPFS